MKSISLKLEEYIFRETESIIGHLKTSRNKYINEAVQFYNKFRKEQLLEKQLKLESSLVCEDSLEVLGEFDSID